MKINLKVAWSILFIIMLFLGLYMCDKFLNNYYLRMISLLGINIILAITLALTNGFSGVFSLGHAGFMAIGAYVCTLLAFPIEKKFIILRNLPSFLMNLEIPFAFSLIIGGIIAMFFAFIIGVVVLRLKGHYLALSTLGFMIIVQSVLINAKNFTNGARGINNIPNYSNIYLIFLFLIVIFYICYRLINSHYGRAMKAIRENDIAAESFGIKTSYYRLIAFSIGAFGAAIAGGLYAFLITAIVPNYFSYHTTFNIVSMIIIGGSGSLSGGVIGAILITLIPELLRPLETGGMIIFGYNFPVLFGMSQIVLAILVILILIFKPDGIMGYNELRLSSSMINLKPKLKKRS